MVSNSAKEDGGTFVSRLSMEAVRLLLTSEDYDYVYALVLSEGKMEIARILAPRITDAYPLDKKRFERSDQDQDHDRTAYCIAMFDVPRHHGHRGRTMSETCPYHASSLLVIRDEEMDDTYDPDQLEMLSLTKDGVFEEAMPMLTEKTADNSSSKNWSARMAVSESRVRDDDAPDFDNVAAVMSPDFRILFQQPWFKCITSAHVYLTSLTTWQDEPAYTAFDRAMHLRENV